MYEVKIFTLYPEIFPGPLAGGIYGKAMSKGLWNLKTVNIRDYADDKHKTVDDTVFGGGSGMLMKPDIVANSLDKNISKGEKIFYLSPKGKKFNQSFANYLSKQNGINLICGHFEGVDDRLLSTRNIEEISIGDYVLSGGETAAFVILDAVLRLIPGVLGNKDSIKMKLLKIVFWSTLNLQNLKFGKVKVFQMYYFQVIMRKLKAGVCLNLRI